MLDPGTPAPQTGADGPLDDAGFSSPASQLVLMEPRRGDAIEPRLRLPVTKSYPGERRGSDT